MNRAIPLGGDGGYEVRIVPEAIAEFRAQPEARRLLAKSIEILGQDPYRPRRGKAGLMRGHEPVRKFRPPGLGATRVYYAIDDKVVWLLGVHPRSKGHRAKDLRSARKRLDRHGKGT